MLSYKKEWLSWPHIRAHLCTLAVSLSFNSSWRVPRDGFRYGGLAYGIALTIAIVVVALPITLLQLAIGQLSQQDAVGVWRAVPFFRGVGYMRVIASFTASVYTSIYVALTITYFLYSVTHSIPYWECIDAPFVNEDDYNFNASECINNETFLSSNNEKPEYYLASAIILVLLWIAYPFIFYNPVKLMKRIFYALGPIVLVAGLSIAFALSRKVNLESFVNSEDWLNYLEPHIWYAAVVQAIWSTQVAGGFLILAGDSIYFNTNVQWTTIAIICTNVLTSWGGLLFWYGISLPDNKDTGMIAVLVQVYDVAFRNDLNKIWPLYMFTTLFLSGMITMLTVLYPVYDFIRRIGWIKWRIFAFLTSAVAAGFSLGVLSGRLPALHLLEEIALPLLINLATVLEILAFIVIYGWKVLVEDIEFLTGRELSKFWVWGWCFAPVIIVPITIWWFTIQIMEQIEWNEPPWDIITMLSTVIVAFIIFFLFAAISVGKQFHYSFFAKLKSSFNPSRHWGPRDPITHYFWLARREETDRGNNIRSRYNRRRLGQMSGGSSFLNIAPNHTPDVKVNVNQRPQSDEHLYTVHRRRQLAEVSFDIVTERPRSKSADWTEPSVKIVQSIGPFPSNLNNNVVFYNNVY